MHSVIEGSVFLQLLVLILETVKHTELDDWRNARFQQLTVVPCSHLRTQRSEHRTKLGFKIKLKIFPLLLQISTYSLSILIFLHICRKACISRYCKTIFLRSNLLFFFFVKNKNERNTGFRVLKWTYSKNIAFIHIFRYSLSNVWRNSYFNFKYWLPNGNYIV